MAKGTIADGMAAARRRAAKRVAAGIVAQRPTVFCHCPTPEGRVNRTGVIVCQRCHLVAPAPESQP